MILKLTKKGRPHLATLKAEARRARAEAINRWNEECATIRRENAMRARLGLGAKELPPRPVLRWEDMA